MLYLGLSGPESVVSEVPMDELLPVKFYVYIDHRHHDITEFAVNKLKTVPGALKDVTSMQSSIPDVVNAYLEANGHKNLAFVRSHIIVSHSEELGNHYESRSTCMRHTWTPKKDLKQ